jgi:hypothetical protein
MGKYHLKGKVNKMSIVRNLTAFMLFGALMTGSCQASSLNEDEVGGTTVRRSSRLALLATRDSAGNTEQTRQGKGSSCGNCETFVATAVGAAVLTTGAGYLYAYCEPDTTLGFLINYAGGPVNLAIAMIKGSLGIE